MDIDFGWKSYSQNLNAFEQLCLNREGVSLNITGNDHNSLPEGNAIVTNFNVIWKPSSNADMELLIGSTSSNRTQLLSGVPDLALFIPLGSIVLAEGGEVVLGNQKTTKSDKLTVVPEIVLHCSSDSLIHLKFCRGGQIDFFRELRVQLANKSWLSYSKPTTADLSNFNNANKVGGISGIERRMIAKGELVDSNLAEAFKDLKSLQLKALETVKLCRTISSEMKSKAGIMNQDDVDTFKSYLLSMGLADNIDDQCDTSLFSHKIPSKNSSKFHHQLAVEICNLIQPLLLTDKLGHHNGTTISETSYSHKSSLYQGFMTLPEAYCRINRVKMFEMVSPEDMVQACNLINTMFETESSVLDLNIIKDKDDRASIERLKFKIFESELSVLCLESLLHFDADFDGNDQMKTLASFIENPEAMLKVIGSTNMGSVKNNLTKTEYSISPEEMARIFNVPVFIAKERLLKAELMGKLCRDDSLEGLRFYPNAFTISSKIVL